jgi:amino acid adenylation domain-containing protein
VNEAAGTGTLPQRLARAVERHGARIAICSDGVEWSYRELAQRTAAIASRVLARELEPGDPVALLSEHGASTIALLLGALRAGQSYVVLDAHAPPARLAAQLAQTGARLLLTDKTYAEFARELRADAQDRLELGPDPRPAPGSPTDRAVAETSAACLLSTSGSSGAPKTVWQDHAGLRHHADVYTELIGLCPDDRLTLLSSFSLAAAATPLYAALLGGATLCPFDVRTRGVERLAQYLDAQRITIYHSVPTVFRHLLRARTRRCFGDELRLFRLGGEPLLRADLDALAGLQARGSRCMHALSSTETGLVCAHFAEAGAASSTEWRVPVGRSVRGVELELVDADGRAIEDGEVGRLIVRSAHIARGYWGEPAGTDAAFRSESGSDSASDQSAPRRRTFVTGDLLRRRPDGLYEHHGRVDEQVKIRGQRVDLAGVEAALLATGVFETAAAAARKNTSGECRLVAYGVPRPDRAASATSPAACRAALQALLPPAALPDDYVLLAALPETASGKLDRRALPAPPPRRRDARAARAVRAARARDGVEQKLAALFESVLELAPIGRRDDFFELGGTSIQAVLVLARIEDELGLALPPSTLLEHSSVERLSELVASRTIASRGGPLVRLRESATGRPLFLFHGGLGDVANYAQLARRLPERPVYAFQAVGLDGAEWPLFSVPAMAQRYVRDVLALDPHGPYLLAGSCMGGLIALEAARQLANTGRAVALVALFDTEYPLPKGRRLRRGVRAWDPFQDALRIARWALLRAVGLGRSARWLPAYRHFVHNMNGRARRAFRPQRYDFELTLFLASGAQETTPDAATDARLRLGACARALRTVRLAAPRARMLQQPAVDELAAELRQCIDAAERANAG